METETYRLFFALWPDLVTRAAIYRTTRAAVRHAGGRPVSAENYHLTLAFLGEQPAALLPAIIEAGASLEVPTGEMRLSCLGYFERARVLWLGPENTPNPLRLHVRRLWQALAPLGIARERRPFAAHLTLARKVNRAPSVAVRPVRWRYAGFALVESVTQVQGARYRVIAGWPLVVGADAERME